MDENLLFWQIVQSLIAQLAFAQNLRRAGGNPLFSEIAQSLIAQLDTSSNPQRAVENSSSPQISQQPVAKFDSTKILGGQAGIQHRREFRSSLLRNSILPQIPGDSLYNHALLKSFSDTLCATCSKTA